MKIKIKVYLTICLLTGSLVLAAQCTPEAVHVMTGNAVEASITNGGDLFISPGALRVPAHLEAPPATLFNAGLWMGGYIFNRQLAVAAQNTGRTAGNFDFRAGPLLEEGINCENFNQIWVVDKVAIQNHIQDWQEDGIINHPEESVFGWPGVGNLFFAQYNGFALPFDNQGWAPFHDLNENGLYEPDQGDYPHPSPVIPELIPEQITWTVFNEGAVHMVTGGPSMQVEVQLTTWNIDCVDNYTLRHSIFTSHKIVNRSAATIDSFRVGVSLYPQLGCPKDDCFGSYPQEDGIFIYNRDNYDGIEGEECFGGVSTYGNLPPVQSIVFLNHPMDKSIYYVHDGVSSAPNNIYDPDTPEEYYNYLAGHWQDAAPLTYGAMGNDPEPNAVSTNHVFPGDPNEADEWSMFSEGLFVGGHRMLGSSYLGVLEPFGSQTLDMAYGYVQAEGLTHLEQVPRAYKQMGQLQFMYDEGFNGYCDGLITNTQEIVVTPSIQILPNPTQQHIILKTDLSTIDGLRLYGISGKIVYEQLTSRENIQQLDFSNLQSGMYFLEISSGEKKYTQKVIIAPK